MKLILLIILFSLSSHAYHTKWYEPETKLKGIALTIHGLNLNPLKMEGIIHELQEIGLKTLNLSLSGHSPNEAKLFQEVTIEMWLDEFSKAYKIANKEAKERNLPLYFVGFSLGGALGVSALNADEQVDFEKMILFAPAIKIKSASKILKLLSFAPTILIPSFSPKEYRAYNSTPIAAYNALYDLLNSLDNFNSERNNIPTLLFCSEDDELVSFSKIESLIEEEKLSNWKLFPIEKEPLDKKLGYDHLIIDARSVGHREWSRILSLMNSFLIPQA